MYSAIEFQRKTGAEEIVTADGNKVCTLADFWRWAYSDLNGNTERGALAEFIVACALGIQDGVRISWDRYDLVSAEGITIEVKASGYLQSWQQEKLSNPIFGIRPTFGWDSKTNKTDTEKQRQADIYVFCVYRHKDKKSVNPLDISQWEFYLLPTEILNQKCAEQKTISMSALIKIGAERCQYENLHKRIVELIKE